MKRSASIKRVTGETRIQVRLEIDGRGRSRIETGIPFFDHMLTLFAKHATVDLRLRCQGDLEVDAHHTVEDCGIALGQAFLEALGDKKGIRRYGAGFDPRNPFTGEAHVPMDECLARCVVDFCGRPCLVWRGLDRMRIGGFRLRTARRICLQRSASGSPGNSSRALATRLGAICTWSFSTGRNRITSWSAFSRLLPGRLTRPASMTRGLPGSFPAPRDDCE